MDKKLIAIDLDGTLFYPKERFRLIHPKNVSFIQRMVDAGHEVVLVTSRSQDFTEKTIKKINRPLSYVSRNGAVVMHEGKLIEDRIWPKNKAFDLYQTIQKMYPNQAWSVDSRQSQNVVHVGNHGFWVNFLYRLYYIAQGAYREPYTSNEKKFLNVLEQEDIHRVLIYFGLGKKGTNKAKEACVVFKETFPNFEFSWIEGLIEIAPLSCNKLTGLRKIMDIKSIPENRVYVVGDSGNDTVLFKAFFPRSFVMNNAHPEIKKQAMTIIKRVYEMEQYLS
jgi:HAD superfamily hydrolase (TIGR01484 family)